MNIRHLDRHFCVAVALAASLFVRSSVASACEVDTDCSKTCGGEVCEWSGTGGSGGPDMCEAAGSQPGMDGWCNMTSDCTCASEGATCDTSTHYCSFTTPMDGGAGDAGSGDSAPADSAVGDTGPVGDAGTPDAIDEDGGIITTVPKDSGTEVPDSGTGGGSSSSSGCSASTSGDADGWAMAAAGLGIFFVGTRRRRSS
jgi:MYXO-CTERM domain-containing protein